MKLLFETHGQGPDLVLLHGWGMNNAVWSTIINQLVQKHKVTAIELPGHGGSEYNPEKSSLQDWAEAVLAVAPENATWLGWSLGGLIAQYVAINQPHRITKLLLVTSSPRFVTGEEWPHAMLFNTLKQFARALTSNHQKTLERFLSLQVQGDEAARETLRLLREDLALRPSPNNQALEDGLDLLLTVDLRDELNKIECPTFWLLGDRDTLVPADVGEALEELMPRAEVLIMLRSAHAPFLSHTEQCVEALTQFLEPHHE